MTVTLDKNRAPYVAIAEGPCFVCHLKVTVEMPATAYETWRRGVYIQNALHMLSDGQREFLISGTCEKCFDRLFSEPEPSEREGAPDMGEEGDVSNGDPISDGEREHDDPLGLV